VLALAEVKETSDAWPSDGDPSDDYDDYEDEDDEEEEDYDDASRDRGGDHEDYQLNELIDDEIILGWWTPARTARAASRYRCTSPTRRCVPPR